MRMSRRMGLNSIVRFKIPTFSGTYVLSGDEKKGQMILKTSGTLTLSKGVYDIFVVGGGASGACAGIDQSEGGYTWGGGGGGSGCTTTKKTQSLAGGQYTVTIGAGGVARSGAGAHNAGGATSIGSIASADGGQSNAATLDGTYAYGSDGGSGGGAAGVGGSDGNNGNGSRAGRGQGTTTRAFAESSNTLYAGGGSSGMLNTSGLPGSDGGGGAGSTLNGNGGAGTTNTGSGGGGTVKNVSGAGSSGLVIVRWGY